LVRWNLSICHVSPNLFYPWHRSVRLSLFNTTFQSWNIIFFSQHFSISISISQVSVLQNLPSFHPEKGIYDRLVYNYMEIRSPPSYIVGRTTMCLFSSFISMHSSRTSWKVLLFCLLIVNRKHVFNIKHTLYCTKSVPNYNSFDFFDPEFNHSSYSKICAKYHFFRRGFVY